MYRNKTLLWSRESVTIHEFLDQYRNKLPIIVKISEINKEAGHWRNINVIYRVQKCEKQPRILTRDADDRRISLPIQARDKFYYIPHRGSILPDQKPRNLPHILFTEILPYSIKQDYTDISLAFHTETDIQYGARLGELRVEKSYAEDMLMGNIITEGTMFPAVMVIPSLLNLKIHIVIGLADGSDSEFQEMLKSYDTVAEKISYSEVPTDVYLKPPEVRSPTTTSPPQVKPPTGSTVDLQTVVPPPIASPSQPEVLKQRGRNRIFAANVLSIASAASLLSESDTDSGIEDFSSKFVEKLRKESIKKRPTLTVVKEDKPLTRVKQPTDSGYKDLAEVPQDLSCLSVMDVSDCLFLLHMAEWAGSFVTKQIDGALLQKNFDEIKKDLNIAEVEATKLEKFVKDGWRPKLAAAPKKELYRNSSACDTRL